VIHQRRRPAAATLAALFLGGLCSGTSACDIVHENCTSVAMGAGPVHGAAPYGKLEIPVTVTAGGRPVAEMKVNFWVRESGSNIPVDFSEAIGTQKTDASGTARVARDKGFFGLILPGRTVTGYWAQVVPGMTVAGVNYCAHQTQVQPLSCGIGNACGPMPPLVGGIGVSAA
jgi:hypothetical protein